MVQLKNNDPTVKKVDIFFYPEDGDDYFVLQLLIGRRTVELYPRIHISRRYTPISGPTMMKLK